MTKRVYPMLALLVVISMIAGAQEMVLMQQLENDEQEAIEAIALYPEEERSAILLASSHPEILVRMENLRKYSESDFREMISELSEDDQKRIYNIFRYPDLVRTICNNDEAWSPKGMEMLLQDFPEEIHSDANDLNRDHFTTLKDLLEIYNSSERTFNEMLERYPEDVRWAYRQLVQLPEVVTILTDNMSMTVLLGDIYRNDPEALSAELDSLNAVVAEERSAELNKWKTELEEDTMAMREYEQAARDFAREQGYDSEYYNEPMPGRYREEVYVQYIWTPYPYWFGWPTWYGYECWYPYPWWYHWGYYYGPGEAIVIVGLPSRVFLHWQFYNYRHLYYYPHFANRVIHHAHYGSHRTSSSVTTVVRNWERENRADLPQGWLDEDGARADRIREYGLFRIDHEMAVNRTVDKAPTKRDFLRENAQRYPTLRPVLGERSEPGRSEPREQRPEVAPPVKPERYQPREKVIQGYRTTREEEVDRAREQHENIWDKNRKTPTRDQPVKRAPVIREPRVAPRPAEPRKDVRPSAPRKSDPIKKKQPVKRSSSERSK